MYQFLNGIHYLGKVYVYVNPSSKNLIFLFTFHHFEKNGFKVLLDMSCCGSKMDRLEMAILGVHVCVLSLYHIPKRDDVIVVN